MKTKSCSEQNQQEDSKQPEKAWDENPFHCSAEWHFTMPWKDEGDPLGQQLHAISGGLAKG